MRFDQPGRATKYSILTLLTFMLAMSFGAVSAAAFTAAENTTQPANERPLTTYERFLPLAIAGDPDIQHFIGYMFYYGEGVEQDYDEAHYWFHLAAEEGDSRAQRNLGIYHSGAIGHIPDKFFDPNEANIWFSLAAANPENPEASPLAAQSYDKFLTASKKKPRLLANKKRSGEYVYNSFCAGCHGFGGYAAYSGTPSFTRGDRLEKSDHSLAVSILQGKGKMPSWGDALSAEEAGKVVSYIRQVFGHNTEQDKPKSKQPAVTGGSQLAQAEKMYLRFCGGCHGFNGIAWYVNSPSFALGERMDKSDAELKYSINNGIGAMPAWENMLTVDQIDALLQFVRSLAKGFESGIIGELRRPEQFLQFRPKGETGNNWTGDDFR